MYLTAEQRAMADGEQGEAVAAAMQILVEYGDIMGAEDMVEIASAAGANIYGPRHSAPLGSDDPERLFGRFSLRTDGAPTAPAAKVHACQLIGPIDREAAGDVQGMPQSAVDRVEASQSYLAGLGVSLLNTCTPYQVGFLPEFGDHCAWMESSAVVFINSVIGARTNTEGRESAAASMLTGLTPNAGLHLDGNRKAEVRVRVEAPVEDTFAWNVLGYWIGSVIDDAVPVLDGITATPDLVQLKQLGAAAASSGDVELFHIPGVTAECRSVEEVLRPGAREVVFGPAELAETVARLNVTRRGDEVDFVMIGCPHASYGQLQEVAALLEGRTVSPDVALWIFTPSALRDRAREEGLMASIEASGARVLSDTCPAIAQFLPPGTRRFATDSAKQGHYLPAIMGVEGAFAPTADCVRAAIDGRLP
ncbi:aconitase X [Georgenia alba]|uniref:Aconitase X n=1 Tax=Georgenia alba TaxID=2233858 RepID=A0ABW2QAK9_9MICO